MKGDTLSQLPLRGVLPVFQTPYHDDESIDWATLEREIDWLLGAGAHGVVMAMVSEYLRLDFAERREMAAKIVQFAGGRGTVIISVGAESSRMAEENAGTLNRSVPVALWLFPPVSIGVGESELIRYYERIIRACHPRRCPRCQRLCRTPYVDPDASFAVG